MHALPNVSCHKKWRDLGASPAADSIRQNLRRRRRKEKEEQEKKKIITTVQPNDPDKMVHQHMDTTQGCKRRADKQSTKQFTGSVAAT